MIQKWIFDEQISNLENKLLERDIHINDYIKKVNEMEVKIETLEKCMGDSTTILGERMGAIEKQIEETNIKNTDDDKIVRFEKRIYILEKRRLGSDFCEYCQKEFNSGSEKDRREKDCHIRKTHTFECKVCDLKNTNKEELETHLLTCEIYVCSLCTYRHKRLIEMNSHFKSKYTRNTINRHWKMDRDNSSKVTSTNYFSEEIWVI